jgi:acyl carrier protein
VVLEKFPLSPNGKVDRHALPAPDFSQFGRAVDYVPPRSPIEETLIEMWTDIFGVERIGVNHNFFEIGGHSLLATQMTSRIRETFHIEFPLRHLFESPTVAGLAVLIEQQRQAVSEPTLAGIQALPRGEKSFDELLSELDHLSPEEVHALLGETTRSSD